MSKTGASVATRSVKSGIARDAVLRRIVQGEMKPGERIPSEMQLAAELGMNKRTVRRGLAQLVDEGVIVKQPGAGSFVQPGARLCSTALLLPEHLFQVEKFSATGLLYEGARRVLDQEHFNISMLSYRMGHLWDDVGPAAVKRGVRGALVMVTGAETPSDIQRLRDRGVMTIALDAGPIHRLQSGGVGWIGFERLPVMMSLGQGFVARGFERVIAYRRGTSFASSMDDAALCGVYEKDGKAVDFHGVAFETSPLSSDWSGFDLLPASSDAARRGPRTVVLVPDETIALDVFRVCYARGLRVPQDVAIAAIMDHAPHLHPIPLTAVNGAKLLTDMTSLAARKLKSLMDGEPDDGGGIVLPAPVEWKASTEVSVV